MCLTVKGLLPVFPLRALGTRKFFVADSAVCLLTLRTVLSFGDFSVNGQREPVTSGNGTELFGSFFLLMCRNVPAYSITGNCSRNLPGIFQPIMRNIS